MLCDWLLLEMGVSGSMFKTISKVNGWQNSGLSGVAVDTIQKVIAHEKVDYGVISRVVIILCVWI